MTKFSVEQIQVINLYREAHNLGYAMTDEAVVSVMQQNNDIGLLKSVQSSASTPLLFNYASDNSDLGLTVEKQSKPVTLKHEYNPVTTQLTTEQAQDLSIEYLSENLQSALEIYMQIDNGVVSQSYDALKSFFETDLSSKHVGEVISKENDCIAFLQKAKNGRLTKREYYEQNKERLKEMLMDRVKSQDETGIDAIDKYRKGISREEFESRIEKFIQNRIDTISTMQGIKDFQHELIMQSEEETLALIESIMNSASSTSEFSDVASPDLNNVKLMQHPFESDELMSFEDTYELERGVKFSEQVMENLLQAKGELSFAQGAYNKVQGLKNSADDIISKYKKSTEPQKDEYGVEIYTPPEPDAEAQKDKVLELIREYYAMSPENAVSDINSVIDKCMLNLEFCQNEDGDLCLDFTDIQKDDKQKNNALNLLLKGMVSLQEERLQTVLDGKSIEQYIDNYQNEYKYAMGCQNAEELSEAMREDQMTVVDKATGAVSMGGMTIMVIGGVLSVTPAAPLGAGMISLGGKVAMGGMAARNGLGFAEAYSRKTVSEEEINNRCKDLAMDVAGVLVGGYAGKQGLKFASDAVKNGAGRISAFAIEHGTDFTISVLGDLAMIGLTNYNQGVSETLKQNGIGILVSTLTGITTSKAMFASDYKLKNAKQDLDVASDVELEMSSRMSSKSVSEEVSLKQTKVNPEPQSKISENPQASALRTEVKTVEDVLTVKQYSDEEINSWLKENFSASDEVISAMRKEFRDLNSCVSAYRDSAIFTDENFKDMNIKQLVTELRYFTEDGEDWMKYCNLDNLSKIQKLYNCTPEDAVDELISISRQSKNFKEKFNKAIEIYNVTDMDFDDIMQELSGFRKVRELDAGKVSAYKNICDKLGIEFNINDAKSLKHPEQVTPEILERLKTAVDKSKEMGIVTSSGILDCDDFDSVITRMENINQKCAEIGLDKTLKKLNTYSGLEQNTVKLETVEKLLSSEHPEKVKNFMEKLIECTDMEDEAILPEVVCYIATKDFVIDNPARYLDYFSSYAYSDRFSALLKNADTSEKLEIVDKILQDESLYSNSLILTSVPNIFKYADTPQKTEFFRQIFFNENMIKNRSILEAAGAMLASNTDGFERCDIIYKIFSNEKICQNEEFMSHAPEFVSAINSNASNDIAKLILENPKYYENKDLMANIGEIFANINTKEQMEFVGKVLEDEKLLNNKFIIKNMTSFISSAEVKTDFEFLDRVFKSEQYVNNEKFIQNLKHILPNMTTTPKRVAVLNKILADKTLYENEALLKTANTLYVYRIENAEKLLDRFIKDKALLESPDVLQNITRSAIMTHTDVDYILKALDTREAIGMPYEEFSEFFEELSKLRYDISSVDLMKLEDRLELYDKLSKKSIEAKTLYKQFDLDIEPTIFKLSSQFNTTRDVIKSPKQSEFVQKVLANNNAKYEDVLKNFDFARFEKQGLPLKYSRAEFCNNINGILSGLNAVERDYILKHFGIIQGEKVFASNGRLLYQNIDGFMNNKPLDKNSPDKLKSVADKIIEEIEKFTIHNEVKTGDKTADEMLTALIQGCPEFAEIVGKEQHGTHKYSVDIHTLKVLQSAMNNPLYSTLSDTDKTILKMSVLLHDTGKKGGVVDKGHQDLSAEYTNSMLKKYRFPRRISDRIVEIVENHHWFEEYNTGRISAEDVAVRCRCPEDFTIYKIFSKADFENVNDNFHLSVTNMKSQADFDAYMERKIFDVEQALKKIQSNSNLIFDTQFVKNGEKFPKETVVINGEPVELKVLNLNTLVGDEDLSVYGFPKGTTKKDLRLNVHMTYPEKASLETVDVLSSNPLNESSLSTSLIKPDNNRTYADRQFGLILDSDQFNIADAYFSNFGSGQAKGIDVFKTQLFDLLPQSRTFVKDSMIEALNDRGISLTDAEYAELAKKLMNKKYLTQIREDIKIGDKVITAKDLTECLEISRDRLFDGGDIHSEIVSINARVKGLIAKVDNIDDCPQEFLEFAKEHDLPIILMKPEKISASSGRSEDGFHRDIVPKSSNYNDKVEFDAHFEQHSDIEVDEKLFSELGEIEEFKKLSDDELYEVYAKYGFNVPERIQLGHVTPLYKPDMAVRAKNTYRVVDGKKVLKPEVDKELRHIATILRDEALIRENQITDLMKKYNLAPDNYKFEHRAKSVQSLYDKLKNFVLDDKNADKTLSDAMRDVKDAVGVRTIAPKRDYTKHPQVKALLEAGKRAEAVELASRLQSREIFENLMAVAKSEDCPLKIKRLTNYKGKDGLPYLTDAQLTQVKYADRVVVVQKNTPDDELGKYWLNESLISDSEKQTTKVRESGYTAFQMNFSVDDYVFEWQFRGKEVNDFAENEHIVYDIRSNKDIVGGNKKLEKLYQRIINIIGDKNNMSDKEYAEYNQYLTDYYKYLREKELGFASKEPQLIEYECPQYKELEAENLMHLHDLVSQVKKEELSPDVALAQYMDKIR